MTFLAFLLSALVAADAPAAREVSRKSAAKVEKTAAPDPVELEYEQLLEQDDATQKEVDKWIKDADAFEKKGAGSPKDTLNLRINQRFQEVRKAYESFLQRHPKHARAFIAYGSFLNDIGEEEAAVTQWDRARELDPKNPAAWNNLANYYGHRSPVKKAFEYYAKAIDLDPSESVYYFNFATTVYLFRKDAREYFQFTENQVFDKALELYRQALKYDPTNFVMAADYAQSFYGTKPPRLEDGLAAWREVLKLAHDDFERQGVFVHFARLNLSLGRFAEARQHLNSITDERYAVLKTNLVKKLARDEGDARTNAAAIKPPAG